MAGKNVHEMDLAAPLLDTDELYLTRSPYGIGDDAKATLPDVAAYVDEKLSVHGSVAIGNGESGGSVTGLDLDSPPTSVLLTVQSPTGGGFMVACIIGDLTTDGFDFALSGMTDSANYKLHYYLFLT